MAFPFQISVQDLVIAYSPELPPVIKGISFDLKPREKIGLIGRTVSCFLDSGTREIS
jgi:ABC-type multidrug transport system fused ATPase/permease subunit